MTRAAERSFRRFHLNTWLSGNLEAVITDEDWAKNKQPLQDDLKQRHCYLGVDLSSRFDLSAVVAVFPDYDTGSYDIQPHFWLPSEGLKTAGVRDKVPYERWHRNGHLNVSEGPVINIQGIVDKIKRVSRYLRRPRNSH